MNTRATNLVIFEFRADQSLCTRYGEYKKLNAYLRPRINGETSGAKHVVQSKEGVPRTRAGCGAAFIYRRDT